VLPPKELFPDNWELPLDLGSTLNFLYSKEGIFTKKINLFFTLFVVIIILAHVGKSTLIV
jgi:hypothetical protein